ncbi:MAG: hypothetical protein JJE17_00640 [Peptostreptococcaceae bacterium]|nr:hypothetical protein [Peptostreptococcaceae bacterium]
MERKRVIVTKENETGRNTQFVDTLTNATMSRANFVKQIKSGNYNEYYVREINGVPTPVSKPDGDKNNNLD